MTQQDLPKISPLRHVIGFASFSFVTANLLLWFPLLLITAIIRFLVPLAIVKEASYQTVERIYRLAAVIDAWWFINILAIEFEVDDPMDVMADLAHEQNPVIICNHQSWFDIFLLQTLICTRGPILKFVIKSELLWVPVLGWICLVLNFPRLKRHGDAKARAKDLHNVATASLSLSAEPGGLLIFPEGTRFNAQKKADGHSPHEFLLRPRAGGVRVIQSAMPAGMKIWDFNIYYKAGEANCWRCMSGAVDKICVRVESFEFEEVEDSAQWLNQRWSIKDRWLASMVDKAQ